MVYDNVKVHYSVKYSAFCIFVFKLKLVYNSIRYRKPVSLKSSRFRCYADKVLHPNVHRSHSKKPVSVQQSPVNRHTLTHTRTHIQHADANLPRECSSTYIERKHHERFRCATACGVHGWSSPSGVSLTVTVASVAGLSALSPRLLCFSFSHAAFRKNERGVLLRQHTRAPPPQLYLYHLCRTLALPIRLCIVCFWFGFARVMLVRVCGMVFCCSVRIFTFFPLCICVRIRAYA